MISFIDESGDHNLELEKLDNQFNVFVLAAVIFKVKDYSQFDSDFRKLKRRLFGDENYIVHTAEINRPSKASDPRTSQFVNREFREKFYNSINKLIDNSLFKIASCAIRKEKMINRYGSNAEDPYAFCFENILNRILFECDGKACKIYPEKRTHTEDVKLELNLLKMKTTGTQFFRGAEVGGMIEEFALKDKKENISGLQLADLIVTPIGRHIIAKSPKPKGNEVLFSLIKSKFRTKSFTIFP